MSTKEADSEVANFNSEIAAQPYKKPSSVADRDADREVEKFIQQGEKDERRRRVRAQKYGRKFKTIEQLKKEEGKKGGKRKKKPEKDKRGSGEIHPKNKIYIMRIT